MVAGASGSESSSQTSGLGLKIDHFAVAYRLPPVLPRLNYEEWDSIHLLGGCDIRGLARWSFSSAAFS